MTTPSVQMLPRIEGLQFSFGRRLPVVLQAEAAECGLACLAMVLGFHGHRVDLGTLRRRHSLSLKGMTLRHLVELSGKVGLATRALRVELTELAKLRLPCVLHWGLNHFVVLKKVRRRSLVIHDPALGRRTVGLAELSREFTGVALEMTPSTSFVKAKSAPTLRLVDLFKHVGGLLPSAAQILVLSLGIELVAVLLPIASQIIIDEVVVNADLDLLLVVAVGLAILLLVQLALEVSRRWSIMVVGSRLNYQWSGSLFDHLSRLPLNFFEKRHVGDVISRFQSMATIQKALTTDLVQAVLDGIMSVVMVVMIVIYGHWLALVVLASTLLNGLLRLAALRTYRENTEEAIVAEARQQSHFIETIRGMASVKLLGIRERRGMVWMNQLVRTLNAHLKLQRADLIFSQANDLLFGADRVILLVLGAKAVISQSMSLGMLVAFIAYRDQFAQRVGNLINAWFQLRMLNVQTDRLSDIVLAEPETSKTDQTADFEPAVPALISTSGFLEARGLAMRYGAEEPWVFRDLSLKVRPGTAFAVTGPSGCGKTTLIKILMGLLPATEGTVEIDGRDLRLAGGEAFRRRIAGVMQDDGLFAGSIAENIASFDDHPDVGWIEECAARAAILEDIRATPMGFETLVGDMGSALSGGQKQRIMLARALYRRPAILFLDEATSHLDEPTESVIAKALQELSMTRIIIAHRPATIAHCHEALSMRTLAHA